MLERKKDRQNERKKKFTCLPAFPLLSSSPNNAPPPSLAPVSIIPEYYVVYSYMEKP